MVTKKLLLFFRSTSDLSYDLQFPTLLSFVQYFKASSWSQASSYLTDTALPAQILRFLRELFGPPHAEHEKGKVCQSLFCSIEEEVSKTPQQLEFDDLSHGLPAGASAEQAKVLRRAVDAVTFLQRNVETLELVEVRSQMLRIVCEFEDLRVAASVDLDTE